MKRAIRRQHRERLKRARRFWWGRKLERKALGMVVDTPTPCSCALCANWRALEGPTVAELRFYAELVSDDEGC